MAIKKTDSGDCAAFRPLLSAFADGETTASETARVQKHLMSCAFCTSELAFARAMNAALFAAPREAPAPELFERIAAATYARPTLRERIALWLTPAPTRWALGTALAAGLMLAVTLPRIERSSEIAASAPSPRSIPALPEEKGKADKTVTPSDKIAAIPAVPKEKGMGTPSTEARSRGSLWDAEAHSVAAAPKPATPAKSAPIRIAAKGNPAGTQDIAPRPETKVVALPDKPVKAVTPTLRPTTIASHSLAAKSPAPLVAAANVPKPVAPTSAAPVPAEPAPAPTRTAEKPEADTRVAAKEPEPAPARQVAMVEPTRTAPKFGLNLKNAGVGRREINIPSPPNMGAADTNPSFDAGRTPSLGFNDNGRVASLK